MAQLIEPDLGEPPLRAAFLVRCWREADAWHFSLENVTTRQHRGFDELLALMESIAAELDALADDHDEG